MFARLYWGVRRLQWQLPEIIGKFVGLRLHIHIKREFPKPSGVCGFCGKPYDRIIAIDTGDGWEMSFECENYCGWCDPIVGWYPFWFSAWATSDDMNRAGIEPV